MGDAQKYTVVMSGEIGPGHDIDNAKAGFAELFKTTVEKSEPYFQGKRRVLRKDLGQKQAKSYEEALNAIGIISDLLPQQAEEAIVKTSIELSVADMEPKKSVELSVADMAPNKPVALAVVDMEPKQAPALSVVDIAPNNPMAGLQVEGLDKPKATTSMICPKCKTQQEQADACAECGVIVEKYRQIANKVPHHQSAAQDDQDHQVENDETGAKKFNILAVVGVALIIIVSLAVVLL